MAPQLQAEPLIEEEEDADDQATVASSLSRRSSVSASSLRRASVAGPRRSIAAGSAAGKGTAARTSTAPQEEDASAHEPAAEPKLEALLKMKPRSSMAGGHVPAAARAMARRSVVAPLEQQDGDKEALEQPQDSVKLDAASASKTRRSGGSSMGQGAASAGGPQARTSAVVPQDPGQGVRDAPAEPASGAEPAQQLRRSVSSSTNSAGRSSVGQNGKRASAGVQEPSMS
jgi:hypothetical protein